MYVIKQHNSLLVDFKALLKIKELDLLVEQSVEHFIEWDFLNKKTLLGYSF